MNLDKIIFSPQENITGTIMSLDLEMHAANPIK